MANRFLAIAVLLLAAFTGVAMAQSATGGVNGTITDPTGAVIQSVTVKLTNQGTQIEAQVTTNTSGYFVFANVQPGNYKLSISKSGFKTIQTPEFNVGVNQYISQNLTLEVGDTSQMVEVSAAAPIVQASSSELGTVIEQKEVQELPLNGRNFTQLLSLTPGATPVNTAQGGSVSSQDAAPSGIPGTTIVKPSMNGQQNRSMLFYQDGVLNTDMRGPVYGVLPIIDAIQEFKVQSHNDKAEYGGVTGGIVNLVSASGTNSYHGSAYEYLRNNAFDARNPFTDFKPSANATDPKVPSAPGAYHQNQFGATFGGPIQKNKTFFFLAYDAWRYNKVSGSLARVPTDAELNGDFSALTSTAKIYNPYTSKRDPFKCDASGNPLPVNPDGSQGAGTQCNKLPSSMISPAMQGFLRAYASRPNTDLGSNNSIDNRTVRDSANNWQVKVDHSLTSADNIFLRFSGMLVDHTDPVTGTNSYSPSRYHAFNYAAGWTHVFLPNLFFDFRGSLLQKPYRFGTTKSDIGTDVLKQLGFSNYEQFEGMSARLASPWFTSYMGNRGDSDRSNPAWNISTNLNWVKGNHNFKTGFEMIHVTRAQADTYQNAEFLSSVTADASNKGGLALASAMLGLPSNIAGNTNTEENLTHYALATWAIYAQDEWKVTPKLTVNFGLRWDVETQPYTLTNHLSNGLDLFNQQWLIGAKAGDIPPCSTTPVNPCFPGTGLASVDHYQNIKFMGKHDFMSPALYDNFGPRLGFAWQAMNNTVLRGGISMFYDTVTARSQSVGNDFGAAGWPWLPALSVTANATGTSPMLVTDIMGKMASTLSPSPWVNASGYFNDPDLKDSRSVQWNLELQRQAGSGNMFSVAYVGSKNTRLPYTGYANAARQASPSSTPKTTVDQLRAIPWMTSNIRYSQSIGYSSYNGLQARFQRRLSKDLLTLVSYTWAKSLDNSSGYFGAENGAGGGSAVQNYFDPRGQYSVSGYDVPQFFSWYTVYDLPAGKGKRFAQTGLLSKLLGNWQWNYIFQARSGQPYNLAVNGDPANISGSKGTAIGGYSRPNIIADPFVAGPVAANPNSNCQKTISQGGWAADTVGTADSYINQCAFAAPSGSFGNYGRNSLRSAHVINVDTSLLKNTQLTERFKLQLRFEAFNVLNIQNLGAPSTTIANKGAGGVTSIVGNPRQLQFGARLLF